MNQAYGDTKMARGLVWLCAIGNVFAFFLMCAASAEVSGPGALGWLLVGAGLLAGNAVTAAYAIQQGLGFEWRVQRVFKRVCQGIGFTGEGISIVRSVREGLASRGQYYVPTQTKTITPRLRNVRGSWESWTGIVNPFAGQTLEQYNDAAPAYALAFHVPFVGFDLAENGLIRMRAGQQIPIPDAYSHPGALQTAHAANHSTRVVAPAVSFVPSVNAQYQQVDYRQANVWARELALLKAVPMARCIDGKMVYLPIEEQHWLIAAATGCGKGSWLWSLIFGLMPAWEAGLVKFYSIDPKMIELAMGRDFFEHYADDDISSVELLEQCVREMHERGRQMQGLRRKFIPSMQTPLIVVIIDEIAYLSALMPDKKLRERGYAAITTLLNKGRAPGFAIVSATQDVRKEVLNNRDGYSIRIAGRLTAPMVDLVLGEGAYEAGALCDQIPSQYAGGSGVAYVMDDTGMTPRLCRAAWCSDDDIKGMLQGVPRPTPQPVLDAGAAAQVKDEEPTPQLGFDGQPLTQWQYKVE